jgi:glucose/sorbosone dehydrogenase
MTRTPQLLGAFGIVMLCAGFGRLVAQGADARGAGRGAATGVTSDPFPTPINAVDGIIKVNFTEFASIPDGPDGQPARMDLLVDEPGTRRLFVNDMRGQLYSVSYDGKTVIRYLDINTPGWGVPVHSGGSERGFQSFAFHPQFTQRGARGYGKFYTYTDTSNMTPTADFKPSGDGHTHDAVLLEWTAKNPTGAAYDGEAPRELIRWQHPFGNHNGGQMSFNPLATPGSADYGLLYQGVADGGSGGDPYNHGQSLNSSFGKILRIDPLGTNSANGKYGIPAGNPFVSDARPDTVREIYAYGVRNPQRIGWDPRNGNMFVANIGQNTVEEISPVTSGANLGWHIWEASFRFVNGRGGGVSLDNPRGDPKVSYPVVEYDHTDPLFQRQVAVTGVFVYRQKAIPQLTDLLVFGDNPSGETFYVHADNLPKGGQDAIRRILFNDHGAPKTLLQLIKEKNVAQGKPSASRADLRFGLGPNGQIFILNKRDGTIRLLAP